MGMSELDTSRDEFELEPPRPCKTRKVPYNLIFIEMKTQIYPPRLFLFLIFAYLPRPYIPFLAIEWNENPQFVRIRKAKLDDIDAE